MFKPNGWLLVITAMELSWAETGGFTWYAAKEIASTQLSFPQQLARHTMDCVLEFTVLGLCCYI